MPNPAIIPLAVETINAGTAAVVAILLAPPAVLAYRRGGPKRLWLVWGTMCTLLLILYASLPFITSRALSLPFFGVSWAPVPVLLTGIAVHVLGRLKAPLPLQLLLAPLLFFVVLDVRMGTKLYTPMRPTASMQQSQSL